MSFVNARKVLFDSFLLRVCPVCAVSEPQRLHMVQVAQRTCQSLLCQSCLTSTSMKYVQCSHTLRAFRSSVMAMHKQPALVLGSAITKTPPYSTSLLPLQLVAHVVESGRALPASILRRLTQILLESDPNLGLPRQPVSAFKHTNSPTHKRHPTECNARTNVLRAVLPS